MRKEHRQRMFENRVLRIFGPKRNKVSGEWRKLHNEELHDLYSLPNIIQLITLRRMRWVGHVTSKGERRGVYRALVVKPEGKSHLEDPGIDERIILKWIFRMWDGGMERTDLAEDRDRWQALVNVVMSLQVP